jgi:predicted phage replisome organizer
MSPKKYYWLKLFDNFFADPKIKKLKRLAGGDTYIVILLKIMLQTVKTNGVYAYQGIESTLARELELVIDENEEHIQAVLIYLEKTKLIEEVEIGCFMLTQVPLMLGAEGDSAERVRRHRELKALHCNTQVTQVKQPETTSNTEIEIEKDIDIEPYRGQGLIKKSKVKLNLSAEASEFRQKLINSKYVGHLAPVWIEGKKEDVHINEKGLLYTTTRTHKQIVSSTLNEIWEQLHEINESHPAKSIQNQDLLQNLKIKKIGA